MCSTNPGKVFQKVKAVVAARKQVRWIPGGAIYAGKTHRRETLLTGSRRNPSQPIASCEIEPAILTLLPAGHAKESKTKFTDDVRTENVRIADRDTARTRR